MGFADLLGQAELGNFGGLGNANTAFGANSLLATVTYGTGTTLTLDGVYGCYPPTPTLEPSAPKLGANQRWLDRRVDEMRVSL